MLNPTEACLGDPALILLAPPPQPHPSERDESLEVRGSMNVFISKVEPRASAESGRGLFAVETIYPGEVIAAWGGRITPVSEFIPLPESIRKLSLQIEDDFFLVPQGGENAADFINHSCDPNAGMSGQILVVAMRLIETGEEICYDYAMSDGSPYDEFECSCGAPECRRHVTGHDWARSDLWNRYEGFFSPYLERRIGRIRGLQRDLLK